MKKNNKDNKKLIMSWVLIIIMIASLGGFALMGTGGNSGSNNGDADEIPFQQFQDPETGQIFWGAVKNGEQFIFMDISGYDNRTQLSNLATEIKTKSYVDLYLAENFTSFDSVYLIEKAFRGLKIESQRINNITDCSNTLVLTNNATGFDESCMIFAPEQGEEYLDTEILVYHLIQ
ncbi:MAG: hypothetical protein ACOCXG_03445 [Nanoarchaeota archaeon]